MVYLLEGCCLAKVDCFSNTVCRCRLTGQSASTRLAEQNISMLNVVFDLIR